MNKNIKQKIIGSILGFSIGDSLGYPGAGISEKDFLKLNNGPIKKFSQNKIHPLFFKLNRGQFTDNTRLFILTINSLIKNSGFSQKDIIERLKKWGKLCQINPNFERWPGKTSLKASIALLNGEKHFNSGDQNTNSCACIYRTLPIGIFFYEKNSKIIANYSNKCASYTHNSPVSRGGSIFTSICISKIIKGNNVVKSFSDSLLITQKITKKYNHDKNLKKLFNKIKWSLNNYEKHNIPTAKKILGTGSSTLQTLPLSIFICLQAKNFNNGVLNAANSLRKDSKKEKQKLSKFGWTQQLLECIGGNSDGIGAICGCILGSYYGFNKIPNKYKKIEDYSKLIKLGSLLIKKLNDK
ncbi:MAG: ADP-ribosylglycohydrolase family protein [Candidatus Shapirobacteria bacterium]|nr:ADP-ribosylglycohydrolase family protein [Candidatus Shapirobacteria bacterium]